jgi:hypothetical protein
MSLKIKVAFLLIIFVNSLTANSQKQRCFIYAHNISDSTIELIGSIEYGRKNLPVLEVAYGRYDVNGNIINDTSCYTSKKYYNLKRIQSLQKW